MIDLHQEILKSMRASPVIISQLVAGLDDEQVRQRPAAAEWAVIEVVAHIADVDADRPSRRSPRLPLLRIVPRTSEPAERQAAVVPDDPARANSMC